MKRKEFELNYKLSLLTSLFINSKRKTASKSVSFYSRSSVTTNDPSRWDAFLRDCWPCILETSLKACPFLASLAVFAALAPGNQLHDTSSLAFIKRTRRWRKSLKICSKMRIPTIRFTNIPKKFMALSNKHVFHSNLYECFSSAYDEKYSCYCIIACILPI